MVTNVTNLSRSGLYDWMAQRVSAVLLAVYTIFLLGYLILNPGLTYADWSALFSNNAMRIFSLLTLVALSVSLLGRHVDHFHRLPHAHGLWQSRHCAALPVPGGLRSGDVRPVRLGHTDSLGSLNNV